MVSVFSLGVGELITRAFNDASLTTLDTRDGSTPFHDTAVWSAPRSAMIRLVWVCGSGPNDQTNASGYWWRTASVAGSQLGLRSMRISVPALLLVILYGPEATGCLS